MRLQLLYQGKYIISFAVQEAQSVTLINVFNKLYIHWYISKIMAHLILK